jgi:cell volume regulation protein A
MQKKILPWLRLAVVLTLTHFFAEFGPNILTMLAHENDSELLRTFFEIATLFCLSFAVFYTSAGTGVPSFVIAIFYGVTAHELLTPILENEGILGTTVGLGATLILFSGGLETPWNNFKKLFWKICSLSFIGLTFTALAFSTALLLLGQWIHMDIPLPVAILLGAVLASTDPAAIIPVLRDLRFHNRDTKDIVFSESAMTDVTGTLLTVAFIGILSTQAHFSNVGEAYKQLLTIETAMILGKQVLFGITMGVLGYGLLVILHKFKERHNEEFEADAAFFLFIPVCIFTLAVALGGSGYLAAFIAGLLFVLTKKLHHTERFFNQMIEGFLKPAIFLLLGGLVHIQDLISYAPLGITAAILFMFVIRPLSVFISLSPFLIGKNRMKPRELLFISFVRETGAIPAVLLVTIISLGWDNMEALVPVGMWVILGTLIIEPPLTPLVGRLLKVATELKEESSIFVNHPDQQFVVLGSRGHSFVKRLPEVIAWTLRNGIGHLVVLHCPEDSYSEKGEKETRLLAEREFKKWSKKLASEGNQSIEFEFITRRGLLQDNITALKTEKALTVAFVGRKMLDYRTKEIQRLGVPLYFMD